MNLPQVIRRPAEYPSYTSSFHIFSRQETIYKFVVWICLFRLASDIPFLTKVKLKPQKYFSFLFIYFSTIKNTVEKYFFKNAVSCNSNCC